MAQLKSKWLLLALCLGTMEPVWAQNELGDAQKAVRMRQFDRAYAIYLEVANTGNTEAQYQVGVLHMQGRGTRKDPAKARQWLEKAVEGGHPGAQYLLSQVEEDPERSLSLLRASADQGFAAAKLQLERLGDEQPVKSQVTAPTQSLWFGAARKDDVGTLERLLQQGIALDSTDSAGRTALFPAAVAGSEKAIAWLIKQGLNVNHRDKFGLTAAQTAIEQGQSAVLKQLLKAGADPTQTFSNGDNLLHYAVRLEQVQSVELLLKEGVAVNHHNKRRWTPLDLAEQQQSGKLIALLKARGATTGQGWQQGREQLDADKLASQMGATDSALPPAARAVINSNEALLKSLTRQNPATLEAVLPDGSTLLVLAVKHNKPEMVEVLLSQGARVNTRAYRGVTALQVATRLESENIAARLLEAGADPLLRDETGRDAIHAAIEEEHPGLTDKLLSRVLRSNAAAAPVDEYLLLATQHHMNDAIAILLPFAGKLEAVDEMGRNALWFAAFESNIPLVQKLVKAKVNPARRDDLGRTPFMMAIERGCKACAQALLPGNDVNQQTESGNTALIVAAQQKNAEITRWLVQNKAEVEARNQRGNTALMEAVSGNAKEVVQILLEANASVTRKNRLGFSAIDLAQEVDAEMLKLVRSKAIFGIF